MIFGGRVYSVLIVSASERFNEGLLRLLPRGEYEPIVIAGSVGEGRRRLVEREFDIVLINAPLPDDFGTGLAMKAGEGRGAALMFVAADLYDEVYAKVVDHGVLTLARPAPAKMVKQGLDWLRATRELLRLAERRTASVEKKIEEIRLVNRAKWILISDLKMTEEDAHRYIEKQAMDRCISKREMAENIIRTYHAI